MCVVVRRLRSFLYASRTPCRDQLSPLFGAREYRDTRGSLPAWTAMLPFPPEGDADAVRGEHSIHVFLLLKSGVFAVEIRIPSSLEALCTVVAVVLNRQLAVPVPNQPMQLLKCSARCHIQDKKPPDQPPNDSQSQYVRQHKYKQGETKPGRKCVLGGGGVQSNSKRSLAC